MTETHETHVEIDLQAAREEADGLLAGVWTLVCAAEERDYTAGEIDQIIASCSASFIKLRALPRRAFADVSRVSSDADVVPKRPNKVDKHRIDHGDYVRASGDVMCKVCGHIYYDHPVVVGFEWLRRACDGRLLKL